MRKIHFTFFLLSLASTMCFSQQKRFTLDDVISGGKNYPALQAEKLQNLTWLTNEDSYSYTDSTGLNIINASNGKTSGSLTTSEINAILNTQFRIFPIHSWSAKHILKVFLRSTLHYIDVDQKKLLHSINFPNNFRNPDFSPDNQQIAYTVGRNIFIKDTYSNEMIITNDSLAGIVNGQSVHRNEFGFVKGTSWSPNGHLLAFYHKDETKVPIYPMLDYKLGKPTIVNTRYAVVGGISEEVKVGIFNTQTGQTLYLSTGLPKDRYFTNLAWSPDETKLYIAELNRDQNHMKLKSYDTKTGKLVKVLFEEKRSTYVEPQHPVLFSPVDTSLFIWQSERNGHNHLYLYNTEGTLIKQLTKGNWDVTEIIGWDEKGKSVYVESTTNSPVDRNVYLVDIASTNITPIIDRPGVHNAQLSTSNKYLIDEWSSQFVPHITDLYSLRKNTIKSTEIQKAQNPYANYELGETDIITIKSTDQSTDLYARIIKPINFDPAKKYPVILYVYGGPHSQQVTNAWMAQARMWQQYMAQKGYISFTLDNRGSMGRGQAFEEVIHRQLGVIEMQDQIAGVEFLKNQTFVDTKRIGVHGWSYGGFMTISLMTHFPEFFKAGVAGGPVIDWTLYETMYGERYMDSPEQNPAGYSTSNLLDQTQNLKNKLLIIHGNMDSTVVLHHSIQFAEKCIDENVPVDFFIYPGHPHNVIGPNRVHLMDKVSNYFFDHL